MGHGRRTTGALLAALTLGAAASAQNAEPARFPVPDAAAVADPDVQPAQFKTPAKQPAPKTPAPAPRPVADPPTPVVRIQVRVPADAPPGDDITFVLTVRNTSAADAHKVTVRNPLPPSVEAVVKADPPPDKTGNPREQVWSFGTLKPNEAKTIELVVRPTAAATEVKNLAYVRFEHGEATTTRINKPAVKVTTQAPKSSVRDEPFTVRVTVENTGRVPAEKVRVVENVSASAEVEAVTAGSKKTGASQWEWDVGRLMPGQRRVIEYRVTARQGPEALATTNVSGAKGVLEKDESRVRVLVPSLGVKLDGPTGDNKVPPGEVARYELVVRNTGTLPSAAIKVAAVVPSDCKITSATNGGQVTRDGVTWTIPRLEPDEAYSVRLGLRANTTGTRTVRATVSDARGVRGADELATTFQGAASLAWQTELNPSYLSAGTQGTLTVRVRNTGGEPARNVKVEVTLPPEVGLKQSTPSVRPGMGPVVFPPETVGAYSEATYTITYDARQAATAHFRVRMTADALGDRPMVTEKSVEIVGGGK